MQKIYLRGVRAAIVGAAVVCSVAGSQASALTINLIDQGGVSEGSHAYRGFYTAKRYWESVITNDVAVNIAVSYTLIPQSGPTATLGDASSARSTYKGADVMGALTTSRGSSLDDSVIANLPSVSAIENASLFGGDSFTLNDTVAKALGLKAQDSAIDATIRFNTAVSFDFNTTDGFAVPSGDFVGVAVHEIGHALGFSSMVGWAEYYGGENLDLFRYGAKGDLEWRYKQPAYFSIDGGATQLFGRSQFTNGSDGKQPSHWLDSDRLYLGSNKCSVLLQTQIGIMDPTGGVCQMGIVTSQDLAAFDALGWNLKVDVLKNSGYTYTTAQMFAAVPEPSAWAMMVAGFGLLGGALRSRRQQAAWA